METPTPTKLSDIFTPKSAADGDKHPAAVTPMTSDTASAIIQCMTLQVETRVATPLHKEVSSATSDRRMNWTKLDIDKTIKQARDRLEATLTVMIPDEDDKGAVMDILDKAMTTYVTDILLIQVGEQDEMVTGDDYDAMMETAQTTTVLALDMLKITAGAMIKSYIASRWDKTKDMTTTSHLNPFFMVHGDGNSGDKQWTSEIDNVKDMALAEGGWIWLIMSLVKFLRQANKTISMASASTRRDRVISILKDMAKDMDKDNVPAFSARAETLIADLRTLQFPQDPDCIPSMIETTLMMTTSSDTGRLNMNVATLESLNSIMATTAMQNMTVTAAKNKAMSETVLLLANGIKTSRQLAFLRWLAHTNMDDRTFITDIESSDSGSIFRVDTKGANDILESPAAIEEAYDGWWGKLRMAAERRSHRFATTPRINKDQDIKSKHNKKSTGTENADIKGGGTVKQISRGDPVDKDKPHDYVDTTYDGTSLSAGYALRFIKSKDKDCHIQTLYLNAQAQGRTHTVNPKNIKAAGYNPTKDETMCWFCSHCGYNKGHCDGGCAHMQRHAILNGNSPFVCQWTAEKP
jgi:hypothetical protein